MTLHKPIHGSNVCLPNKTIKPIKEFGTLFSSNNLVIYNTLHMPNFKYDLLSINKMTGDNECVAIFFPNLCVL